MAFSRPKTGAAKPLMIDNVIVDLSSLLRRLIPSRIKLNSQLTSGAAVKADAGQLEQVIVNLVINAVDAMSDTGEISICTRVCSLNEIQRAAHPWALGNQFVNMQICDTGPGITPEVSTRIFEPFFTTKSEGKGSGLGLSVVWGIVKLHGGFVEVTNRVDAASGACFQVYLPVSTDGVLQNKAATLSGEVWLGTETILLADDHELVRDVTKTLLERAGYRVLLASDGQEALDVFAANKHTIDLVVLDAIMPKVTGFTAYQKIQEAKPGVGIIVASGHTSDVFPEDWLQETKPVMLSKPFRSEDLLKCIRGVLNKQSS
jgi:CheY-like chemotaxis protein